MQINSEENKKIETLTSAQLLEISGGAVWLGNLSAISDRNMGAGYGYQTGGTDFFPTCDRID